MYAGMTNSERQALEEQIKARRAAKAAGTLPKIPIVLQPYQKGGKPHDRGEDRPAGWTAPNLCRTGDEAKFATGGATSKVN